MTGTPRGIKWILNNLGSLIIALALAVLVWIVAEQEAYPNVERIFPTPVVIVTQNMPAGMIAYGESSDTVFLGREITRSQTYSEETARKIDAEVFRIVDEQYTRAKEIITSRREVLDKIAAALLEHETIEGRHVLELLQFGEIRSPIVREPTNKGEDKAAGKKALGKLITPDGLSSAGAAPSPA